MVLWENENFPTSNLLCFFTRVWDCTWCCCIYGRAGVNCCSCSWPVMSLLQYLTFYLRQSCDNVSESTVEGRVAQYASQCLWHLGVPMQKCRRWPPSLMEIQVSGKCSILPSFLHSCIVAKTSRTFGFISKKIAGNRSQVSLVVVLILGATDNIFHIIKIKVIYCHVARTWNLHVVSYIIHTYRCTYIHSDRLRKCMHTIAKI